MKLLEDLTFLSHLHSSAVQKYLVCPGFFENRKAMV